MSDFELRETENKTIEKKGQKKTPFWQKIGDVFKNPKKRVWILIIMGILILGGAAYIIFFNNKDSQPVTSTNTPPSVVKNESPTSQLFASVLDGVMIDSKELSERHPLAVIVENHVDARPQSGLNKASIVYEAIAEGGITRFLALFGENDAEKVGPVRSVRTYFVDWAHGFSAFIAHVGGNMDALDKIKAENSYDLDQFSHSAPYWREYAAGLATEHTMYTSTSKLRDAAKSLNYPTANNFTIYKFKDDPTGTDKEALPANQKISVKFGSSSEYNVSFDYNKSTNSYLRSEAGKPHVDRTSKEQLNPKNIIVMTVKRKPVITRINEPGYEMTTVGSGPAKIYLDGKEILGSWKKSSTSDREIFSDINGNEITFNRGQFWICVIPSENEASVSVQ